MDTTLFDLDYGSARREHKGNKDIVIFTISTLPAYAIEYSDFLINGLGGHKEGDLVKEESIYEIRGNEILCKVADVSYDDALRLVVFYHGIRDYRLLFPSVADIGLVERLALFYEEAEKNFESGAWLSYALMCGAIYEGLLFNKLGKNMKFQILIAEALDNHIDKRTADIMERARNFRNLVHANRFSEAYVSRVDAMDMRTTMDKLIKGF